MDTCLQERLDLLYQSEQIDTPVYEGMSSYLQSVEQQLGILLTEENAGSFVSHSAIALQRIASHAPITEVPANLKALTQKYPEMYALAKQLLQHATNQNIDFAAEASFITLYLCLLSGKGCM